MTFSQLGGQLRAWRDRLARLARPPATDNSGAAALHLV